MGILVPVVLFSFLVLPCPSRIDSNACALCPTCCCSASIDLCPGHLELALFAFSQLVHLTVTLGIRLGGICSTCPSHLNDHISFQQFSCGAPCSIFYEDRTYGQSAKKSWPYFGVGLPDIMESCLGAAGCWMSLWAALSWRTRLPIYTVINDF